MKDARFGKEVVCQPSDPLPRRAIFLTAPPQRAYPEIDDAEAEGDERATVGRHRMVVEVSGDDSFQPLSLCRDWLMHSPPQLLFDHLQLRPQAIGPGLPLDLELAPTRLAADEDEAQEAEGLLSGLPSPRRLRFAAAWRPNSINRVFSEWRDSEYFPNRSRISSRKRRASASCSKPTIMSSA